MELRIIRGEDGRVEIPYSSLEEFQFIWEAMTKGFYITSPDDPQRYWVSPKEVFISKDGDFILKPKREAK